MATPAEILVAIDNAILAMMAGGGAQELDIAGRKGKYFSLSELKDLRKYYSNLANTAADKLPFGMYQTKPKGVNN